MRVPWFSQSLETEWPTQPDHARRPLCPFRKCHNLSARPGWHARQSRHESRDATSEGCSGPRIYCRHDRRCPILDRSPGAAHLTQIHGYWVDPVTGLMWAAQDNGRDVNWENAVKYCRDLRLAGYADWRLANMAELQGMFNSSTNSSGLAGPSKKQRAVTWNVRGNLFLTGNQWANDAEWALFAFELPLLLRLQRRAIQQSAEGVPVLLLIYAGTMRAGSGGMMVGSNSVPCVPEDFDGGALGFFVSGEKVRTKPASCMTGFALHPEAYDDIHEIRVYIAQDSRTPPTGWLTRSSTGSPPEKIPCGFSRSSMDASSLGTR